MVIRFSENLSVMRTRSVEATTHSGTVQIYSSHKLIGDHIIKTAGVNLQIRKYALLEKE